MMVAPADRRASELPLKKPARLPPRLYLEERRFQ